MTKRRSDALQALVREVADLDRDIGVAREQENAARQESVFARQQLDNASTARQRLEDHRRVTREALQLLQGRDDVADETVEALLSRESR